MEDSASMRNLAATLSASMDAIVRERGGGVSSAAPATELPQVDELRASGQSADSGSVVGSWARASATRVAWEPPLSRPSAAGDASLLSDARSCTDAAKSELPEARSEAGRSGRTSQLDGLRAEIAAIRTNIDRDHHSLRRLTRGEAMPSGPASIVSQSLLSQTGPPDDRSEAPRDSVQPRNSGDLVQQLSEKNRELAERVRSAELEKMKLAEQLRRLETDRDSEKQYAVTAITRERDDTAHKLQLEETRRKSAEQRVGLADDELRQAKSLLDDARRRAAEMEAELQDQQYRSRRMAEESEGLQKLVEAARASREDVDRRLQDQQALLHEAQAELERARQDASQQRQRADQGEAELAHAQESVASARRQAARTEEGCAEIRAREQALDQELRAVQTRTAKDAFAREEDAQRVRARCQQLEAQLPALAHEREQAAEAATQARRLLEQEVQARTRTECARLEEVGELRRQLEEASGLLGRMKVEHDRAAEQHRADEQRIQELNACVAPLQAQLVQAQTAAGEALRQAREAVGDMEARSRVLAEKLDAEKRRSSDLSRELGAAYEAARLLQGGAGSRGRPADVRAAADLAAWKEQAMRTLSSQRAALAALGQDLHRGSENEPPALADAKPDQTLSAISAPELAAEIPGPPAGVEVLAGVEVPAWLVKATEPAQRESGVHAPETPEVRRGQKHRSDVCSELSSVLSPEMPTKVPTWWRVGDESMRSPKKKASKSPAGKKPLRRAKSSDAVGVRASASTPSFGDRARAPAPRAATASGSSGKKPVQARVDTRWVREPGTSASSRLIR